VPESSSVTSSTFTSSPPPSSAGDHTCRGRAQKPTPFVIGRREQMSAVKSTPREPPTGQRQRAVSCPEPDGTPIARESRDLSRSEHENRRCGVYADGANAKLMTVSKTLASETQLQRLLITDTPWTASRAYLSDDSNSTQLRVEALADSRQREANAESIKSVCAADECLIHRHQIAVSRSRNVKFVPSVLCVKREFTIVANRLAECDEHTSNEHVVNPREATNDADQTDTPSWAPSGGSHSTAAAGFGANISRETNTRGTQRPPPRRGTATSRRAFDE